VDLQQQQFRQPYWTLKPLYFEVPSMDQQLSGPLFIGRAWLYREISDHISSDLPTNKGVIITGVSGAGKTTVILQLVENSCFGRKSGNESTQKGILKNNFNNMYDIRYIITRHILTYLLL
jgi:RecA-family ATPase